MYQVIKTYGDFEPWWFLDDWKDDIVDEQFFDHFEDALLVYESEWRCLKATFPSFQSQKNLLAAFWNRAEQRWCDECGEKLQQYHSLLLLKNGRPVSKQESLETFEQHNDAPAPPSDCALKL